MKIQLNDVTFLFLIKLDSIQRLENTLNITEQLLYNFNTHILIMEINDHSTDILFKLVKRKKSVKYFFGLDKDIVFHKTWHLNKIINEIKTPFLAIWDVDIAVDKIAICKAMEALRRGYDIAYPYNGICYDVPPIIRNLYFEKKNISFLHRHKNKMEYLYPYILVGGAVIVNKEKYIYSGKENEEHYGWGNDDFDRYYRFVKLGFKIYREDTPLFHLSHPRFENSTYRSFYHINKTNFELYKTEHSSVDEILNNI